MNRPRHTTDRTLGVVTYNAVYRHEGSLCVHVATGRVVATLAGHYDRVYLCAPLAGGPPLDAGDPRLEAANIELVPQPFYVTSLGAVKHLAGITRAYARVCRKSDVVFIRGLCPYIGLLYLLAYLFGCRVCHWIVGDSVALLRTHRRAGRVMTALSLLYAWQDRILSRVGRWLTDGAFVCNGCELARVYHSRRTLPVISSTIRKDEFFHREDTCQDPTVRILFLGYVRPEKGVQYLLEAVSRLKTKRPWELVLVGPSDQFPHYREQLDEIVERTGIGSQLCWRGYIPYGEPVLRCLREADLLVLPTLSEGTPHTLIEAASNSLPIVTTPVGGIPTMIADGMNGLLVPPKDSEALAAAIDRIIEDGELRRRLIRNGIESARKVTVDCFAQIVLGAIGRPRVRKPAPVSSKAAGAGPGPIDSSETAATPGRQGRSRGRALGWVTYLPYCQQDGSFWGGGVSGRVLDALAPHYDKVYLCAPVIHGPRPESVDLQLRASNVEMIPQPFYATSLGALRHIIGIARAYRDVCQKADVLFVRGMCPYIGVLYALAGVYRRRVCHWIVGNTLALLQTHRRSGYLMDGLAMLYACQDRLLTRMGRGFTDGVFLCNGPELGQEYSSPRTVVTVSSAITKDEFFVRADTCTNDTVRILYVGYVRPEKGVEYLIEAVGRLTMRRPWKLVLVGSSSQFPEYRAKLDRLIQARRIQDRVEWAGSVPFGPALLRCMHEADILVLPTLSEGTPRVLVEARANSLPLVATNVGGIPGSVADGVDGLLVSPKDPVALALAIDLIVADGDLRRQLIRNGLRSARDLTVERFTDNVRGILDDLVAGSGE